MTKVGSKADYCLINGKKFKCGNTEVSYDKYDDRWCLYLYGHLIAYHKNNKLYICFQGWRTRTTVDRLEAITGLTFSIAKDMLRYRSYNTDWTEISSVEWYKLTTKEGKSCLELLK